MEIVGTVAVVTGAASGIGRSCAQALADRGARAVVVADIDGPGANEPVRLLAKRTLAG